MFPLEVIRPIEPEADTVGYLGVLARKVQSNFERLSIGIQNIPSGGTTGQVLAKTSATNFAVEWVANTNKQLAYDSDYKCYVG